MVRFINKQNNKGFTLVELVVAMGLSSIVVVFILGIFSTGTTIYSDLHDGIEIHQQGSSIMDFMTSIIMTSDGIENVIDYEGSSFYLSDKKIELAEVRLNDSSLGIGEKHIFTIQEDPKIDGLSIRYGMIDTDKAKATIEVGNYIKTIYTEPLPKGSLYSNARGIELTIEMEKGRSNIAISKNMYFRKY